MCLQVLQVMRDGCGIGQRKVPRLLKNARALTHVAEVQGVVKAAHDIGPHLCNLHHLSQLVEVSSDQIQKAETLKVLRLLVRELHNLVVALAQRLHPQAVPSLLLVNLLRRGQRDVDVATLHSQVEASALVAHKVQRHLREALLLQECDDGLPAQRRASDERKHLVVLAVQKRQLEHVLGCVNLDDAVLAITVQAVHRVPVHLGDVHRHVQRADDAAVAVGEAVLDVVECGVDEYTAVPSTVPCTRLDADRFMYRARVLQPLVRHDDCVLGQQCHLSHVCIPHNILHIRGGKLCDGMPLLDIK
mmetsp:Transcript_29522/g.56731  ORF Transcript_29522/g.56731 Transcript_29522/m.56731 type:complete len:303 (-) Transcript_29522:1577-2485(-)